MGLFDMFGKNQPAKPSELAQSIIDFVGCKCEYFPKADSDKALISAYLSAIEKGKSEGFTPVMIVVDDTLAEWLTGILPEGRTPEQIRDDILSSSSEGGKAVIEEMAMQLELDDDEIGEEIPKDVLDEVKGLKYFISIRDFNGDVKETLIAYIPAENPYEVFAWIPFGGWNECPEAADMIKIARHWYEKYGAVPAVIGHDILEFKAKPLDAESADIVSKEQFAVCPDIVWQGIGTVGALADTLTKSTVWYFWWD